MQLEDPPNPQPVAKWDDWVPPTVPPVPQAGNMEIVERFVEAEHDAVIRILIKHCDNQVFFWEREGHLKPDTAVAVPGWMPVGIGMYGVNGNPELNIPFEPKVKTARQTIWMQFINYMEPLHFEWETHIDRDTPGNLYGNVIRKDGRNFQLWAVIYVTRKPDPNACKAPA
ncbi:hypothetical protein [Variovorax sp. J31P207]|uniref:hypothetical protein n=1 Tax=Variovorax sp. J31P207 TaxID=3053510 RepID=UPI002576CF08|nr:hypothetical protein [Variovorax sp. J31P207]MDM0068356.1 hypothetical protein [Variovorax sp. J31P207]